MERLARLYHLSAIHEAMFPNGKLEKGQESVTTKYFPKTTAWYVGGNWTTEGFEKDMVEIGKRHGIKVISDVPLERQENNLFILNLDRSNDGSYNESLFPQDYLEFTLSEIRIPRMKLDGNNTVRLGDWITIARTKKGRSNLWQDESAQNISVRGVPYNQEYARKAVYLANSIGAPISMNLTYSEGGNTLIGHDDDGPYAVIGKDSYDISKMLMEADLGYFDLENGERKDGQEISDNEVMMAFAIDYGIPKDRIYFIEQPGDFHLDMSMTLFGKNILLNDSLRAFEETYGEKFQRLLDQKELSDADKDELQTLKEIKNRSELRVKFEDEVQEELEKGRFKVTRTPGVFSTYTVENQEKPKMNFFNMVTATTPGSNQKIIIAMGCEEIYKQRFIKLIRDMGLTEDELPNERIYFLSQDKSESSLELNGGIACSCKSIPLH